MSIKTITIWEPWATLIAIEAKRRETRGWPARHVGPIAIHASKSRRGLEFFHLEPFRSVLAAKGIDSPEQLPFGCVIAIARLEGNDPVEGVRDKISAQELAFGDYSDGRHAWRLAHVMRLKQPIPVTGQQGLWDWDAPPGLLESYLERIRGSRSSRAARPTADSRDQ